MGKKNPQEIIIDRKSVPEKTRLRLWVFSGGRCQMRGCNKPLWRHELTMNDGNFAEIAHIIGAKQNAARGGAESESLQIEFSNLMLLCSSCHHEIDTNSSKYSIDSLRTMKAEHEERIHLAVERSGDGDRTNILICAIKIGNRFVPITHDDIRDAISPRYPADDKGLVIQDEHFDGDAEPNIWADFAKNRIEKYIHRQFMDGFDQLKIKHLSVFAIGPMPLLMYLGKCVGDTVPCDVFQSYRDEPNPWKRLEDKPFDCNFIVNRPEIGSTAGKTIFLKLAISDSLPDSKHEKMNIVPDAVYEIKVNEPSPYFVQNATQLSVFTKIYRSLLNEIQEKHGADCHIFILPAVPNSFAVACGRALLPRKDCPITACEFDRINWTFRPVLELLPK